MRAEKLLASACIGALVFAASAEDAHAFCRTTTSPGSQSSVTCSKEGSFLYYPSQCLPYHLTTRESPVIPNAVLSEQLRTAFGTWTAPNPTCTPGITTIELAPVDEAIAVYDMNRPPSNVVGVTKPWVHDGSDGSLALTTVTFRADSGETIEFGIELNGDKKISSSTAPPEDAFDLQTILVHEVGHALGLAHPELDDDPDAGSPPPVMSPFTLPGATARTLNDDDHKAVCWVYPNRAQRMATAGLVASTACELAPGSPSTCDPQITHGCTASASSPRADASCAVPGGIGSAGSGTLIGVALTITALRRRRRANRTA